MVKRKKKSEVSRDSRGLKGDSGIIVNTGAGFVHLNAPYSCNYGVFVVDPRSDDGMSWLRMSKEEADKLKLTPIKCNICRNPATRMSHMWPYEPMGTTCDSQKCRDKDRKR